MEMMSESIKEISKALSIAQSKISNVVRNKDGYGYKYAELSECLEMIKQPLFESELALTQLPTISHTGDLRLITLLMHSSGEWIQSIFPLKGVAPSGKTNEMQALGSGITYIRRYALCAMMGIAQEDDDGHEASSQRQKSAPTPPNPWIKSLLDLCSKNNVDIKEFTKLHNISSTNVESVKKAVSEFNDLLDVYNDIKNNIQDDDI